MKLTKKLIAAAAALSLMAGCSGNATADSGSGDAAKPAEGEQYTIGLAQLVDHTSLNTIRDAFLDELKEKGYTDGENITIDYQNAAGQVSNLDTIMSGYSGEGVDAIVAIATPTAQSAQNYSSDIPVVFSAVSDPVGAGLVDSIEKPGKNITGTSDEVQVDQIADLIGKLTPEAKTIGVLYNAGEANSVSNIKRFTDYAKSKGYEVKEKTGTDLTTLQQAASVLVQDVDVMFSPNDNTVASGMTALAKIAVDAGVPYYVGADSMVQDGGLATVGIDYEELGRETARMTLDVLGGSDPAEMAVKVYKDDLNIYVNEQVYNTLKTDAKTPVENPEALPGADKLILMGTKDKADTAKEDAAGEDETASSND